MLISFFRASLQKKFQKKKKKEKWWRWKRRRRKKDTDEKNDRWHAGVLIKQNILAAFPWIARSDSPYNFTTIFHPLLHFAADFYKVREPRATRIQLVEEKPIEIDWRDTRRKEYASTIFQPVYRCNSSRNAIRKIIEDRLNRFGLQPSNESATLPLSRVRYEIVDWSATRHRHGWRGAWSSPWKSFPETLLIIIEQPSLDKKRKKKKKKATLRASNPIPPIFRVFN